MSARTVEMNREVSGISLLVMLGECQIIMLHFQRWIKKKEKKRGDLSKR
ncbi:MAG: hypothetical protein C5S52_05465 [ANME-2 cluster archaeon]|nr:hypothetical protein [ANME-2 cluster archaeon]